jgi:hypothetical protein
MGFDFIGEKGRRIRGLYTFAQAKSLLYKLLCGLAIQRLVLIC